MIFSWDIKTKQTRSLQIELKVLLNNLSISFHLLKISAKSETKVMKENPRKRLRVPPNSATRVVHV